MKSKFCPKAELSSPRAAAVRKMRFFQENCSWMYAPSVLFWTNPSSASLRAPELTVSSVATGKSLPCA